MESSNIWIGGDPNSDLIEFFYYPYHNSSVIKSIQGGKLWEKKLYDIYKNILKPSSVVVDIGAFIGTHTACFSKLCKDGIVYSFEPCSVPFKCLQKTVIENNLDNVIISSLAISNKHEEKELLTNYDGDSRFKEYVKTDRFKHCAKLQCRTLDSFDIPYCTIIKIDTEKHEWCVLDGSTETINRCRPIILL